MGRRTRDPRIFVSLFICVCCLLAYGSTATSAEKPPLKIGMIGVLSGPGLGYAIGMKINTALAVEDINAKGGINGYPLKVTYEDVERSGEKAITKFRSLVKQDKVLAVTGPLYHHQINTVGPLSVKEKTPLLPLSAAMDQLMKPFVPYGLRILGLSGSDVGRQQIKDFREIYPKVKKVVIVANRDQEGTKDAVDRLWSKQVPQEGLEIISIIDIPTQTMDMAPFVTRIKGAKPDAIFSTLYSDDVIRFMNEMSKQEVVVPVHSTFNSCAQAIISAVGDKLEKVGWVSQGFVWHLKPENKRIWDRFKVELKKEIPGTVEWSSYNDAMAYDTIQVLAEAMRQAKVTPDMDVEKARDKIKDELMKIKSFKSELCGNLVFDHEIGEAPFGLDTVVVKNGRWQPYSKAK